MSWKLGFTPVTEVKSDSVLTTRPLKVAPPLKAWWLASCEAVAWCTNRPAVTAKAATTAVTRTDERRRMGAVPDAIAGPWAAQR